MLTLLLLVAAAALLATGYATERPGLVWVALVCSMLAALTILVPRVVGALRARRPIRDGAADEVAPEQVAPDQAAPGSTAVGREVVFVPGRLTFHDAGCAAVAGKGTSAAARAQLEAGGMTPCRRCLGAGLGTS